MTDGTKSGPIDISESENPDLDLKLDKTGDLSSLITIDIPSSNSGDSRDSPDSSPPSASTTEPIQFESLEDLSPETPIPLSTDEAPPSGLDMSLVDTPAATPDVLAPEPGPGIDSIKKFSENLAATEPEVAAIFPFTLKIEGKLAPEEAEKLLAVLARENMGIREVDLEPQLADGKILIPRISEYAGVLLIQALRGVSARISFGPSDELPGSDGGNGDFTASETSQRDYGESAAEGGRKILVTTADSFPEFARTEVVDTVVASGLLTTRAVEAASSEDYENLLEALIRELRFKAHRRGANGILALRVQLTPLTLPTDYRLTVTGTAVTGS